MEALASALETSGTMEEMGASIPTPETISIKKAKEPPGVVCFEEEVEPAPVPISETVISVPTIEPFSLVLEVVASHQEMGPPIPILGVEVIREEVELPTPVLESAPFEVDVPAQERL